MQGTLPHVEHGLPLDMPSSHFLSYSENERHGNTSAIIVATSVENGVKLPGSVGAGKHAADEVGSGRTVASQVISLHREFEQAQVGERLKGTRPRPVPVHSQVHYGASSRWPPFFCRPGEGAFNAAWMNRQVMLFL